MILRPPRSTLLPYTTRFPSPRSRSRPPGGPAGTRPCSGAAPSPVCRGDRKSTRLNSSHPSNSYAVFCWEKKTNQNGAVVFPLDTAVDDAAGFCFDFGRRITLRDDFRWQKDRFQQVVRRKPASNTRQIRPHAAAFAGKAVALAAAGLAECGPARLERASAFDLFQRRQQVFHVPFSNKLL